MKNLFILALLASPLVFSQVKEEIIENTVNVSQEIIELNSDVARDIASDSDISNTVASDDISFWMTPES